MSPKKGKVRNEKKKKTARKGQKLIGVGMQLRWGETLGEFQNIADPLKFQPARLGVSDENDILYLSQFSWSRLR